MNRQRKLRGRMSASQGARETLNVGFIGTAWAATPSAIQHVPPEVDTIIEVGDETCRVATARTDSPATTTKGAIELLEMSQTSLTASRPALIPWEKLRALLSMKDDKVVKAMLQNSPGPDAKATPIDNSQDERLLMKVTDDHVITLVVTTVKPDGTYFDLTARMEMPDGSSTTMSFGNHSNIVEFSGDQVVTFENKLYNVHVMRFKEGVPYSIYLAGSSYNGKTVSDLLVRRTAAELMMVYVVLTPPDRRSMEYNESALLLSTCMSDCVTKVHEDAMGNSSHLHLSQIRFSPMMHGQYCITGRGVVHPVLPSSVLESCVPSNIAANTIAMQKQAEKTDPGRRPLHAQYRSVEDEACVAFRQHRSGPDKAGPVVTITEPGLQLMTEAGQVLKCDRHIPTQLRTFPCVSMYLELNDGVSVGHIFPSASMMSSLGIPPIEIVLFLSGCHPGAYFERKSTDALVEKGRRLGVAGVEDCSRDIHVLGHSITSIANLQSVRQISDTRLSRVVFDCMHSPYQLITNLLDHACGLSCAEWRRERREIREDQAYAREMCKHLEYIGMSAMVGCTTGIEIVEEMSHLNDLNPTAQPLLPSKFIDALLKLLTGVRPVVRSGELPNRQLLQVRNGLQIVFRLFVESATTMTHDDDVILAGGFRIPVGEIPLKTLYTVVAFSDGKVIQPFHCGDEGMRVEIGSVDDVRVGGISRHIMLDALPETPIIGTIAKVTSELVKIQLDGRDIAIGIPDYSTAILLDSVAIDEALLSSHTSRAHKGPMSTGIKRKIYDEQQHHSASDFVDTETKRSVRSTQLNTIRILSLRTIKLALEWGVVSLLSPHDAMDHIHSNAVSVLKKEFTCRQPCIETSYLVLPVVSVSTQLHDIMEKIDADWNRAIHTIVEGMPKHTNVLQRAGIIAAVALHPGLPSYAMTAVGFMALGMLVSNGSSAASALEALVADHSQLSAKQSRSLMAFASENAPFDAFITVLLSLSAKMQNSGTRLSDTLATIQTCAEGDVVMRETELQRLTGKMHVGGPTFSADLCINCIDVVNGSDGLRSSALCKLRSIKTITKENVKCADCNTWCCPSTLVGNRCIAHAQIDIEQGCDEPQLWHAWMSQWLLPTADIVLGSLVTMFSFDEPVECRPYPSMAIVIAICNGNALLCYVDNCVPSSPTYIPDTARHVREMIETASFPVVGIDMNTGLAETWKRKGYWTLGRKKMRRAPCISKGRISIREFDDVVKIFNSVSKCTRYSDQMIERMLVNMRIFTRLHGAHELRRPPVTMSDPTTTDAKLEARIKEADANVKIANKRKDYACTVTLLPGMKSIAKGKGLSCALAGPAAEVRRPAEYLCPITGEICSDPVFTADGHTYEREAILQWFESHSTSPLTGLPLPSLDLTPNYALK